MKLLIVLAIVATVAYAGPNGIDNCLAPDSVITVCSSYTGTKDDASAYKKCPKGYQIATCHCEKKADCDGVLIEQKADGEYCRGYNSYGAPGIRVCARCVKLIVTCETDLKKSPKIRCPNRYKMTGCSLHSNYMHQNWVGSGQTKRPSATRKNGVCMTDVDLPGGNCKDCRVMARCVRVEGFWRY